MCAKTVSKTNHVHVLIVGAGISGIGTAIRLQEEGIDDFIILEKTDDVGGSWRDNTYPGCECDVPSALYSYSFEQNPQWSKVFAKQPEILSYIKATAAKYDVQQHIRYNQPVVHAQWCEQRTHWQVKTPDTEYTADFVVSCGGYLHEPIIPNIPGLDSFEGHVFHSSRWDHDYDLSNKRVAVIGTGASAIQFVPEIQPKVRQLTIFQRTPQWIMPKPDSVMPDVLKQAFTNRSLLKAWRNTLFGGFESFGIGFRHPSIMKQLEKVARAHIRLTIKNPELREKLTPDYTLGCKRMLLSSHYYPAVDQPNVDLFATGVARVEGNTVIGQDGSCCEVDVIILGTGFYVTEPPVADIVHDGNGTPLSQLWKDGMQAYKGTVISGLPNAFLVLGPNLGIGHNSAFIVIESQINYIMSTIRQARADRLSRIEVRADVQARYNQKVQKALQNTVWNTGGCSSYYLDKNGFNSIGFPWSSLKMQRMLSRADLADFDVVAS